MSRPRVQVRDLITGDIMYLRNGTPLEVTTVTDTGNQALVTFTNAEPRWVRSDLVLTIVRPAN